MNKKFPILYARGNNGKVLTWQIVVDGEAFFTIAGQQDGEKVTSALSSCVVKNLGKKNEIDAATQAISEAQSKFDKKIKTGYKERLEDIDDEGFFEPMLAKNFEDRKDKVTYPCILQCKFNGSRCIATRDGLFTRKGERYLSVPHIEESLKPFFAKFPLGILDGELLGDGFKTSLNETMKLVRKTVHITEEDIASSEKLVKYYIYDGLFFGTINEQDGYEVRSKNISKHLSDNPYYREVKNIYCNNEDEVYTHFQTLIADNEEGAIIRLLDEPYQNKRSSSLLKLKSAEDDEAIILDIMEGSGNWANSGKIIRLKWKDKEFNATFKGSYAQAVDFLKNKNDWIGREVTFVFNGLTGLSTPNYARVCIDNCLKE